MSVTVEKESAAAVGRKPSPRRLYGCLPQLKPARNGRSRGVFLAETRPRFLEKKLRLSAPVKVSALTSEGEILAALC
jgi:hypothetical protein